MMLFISSFCFVLMHWLCCLFFFMIIQRPLFCYYNKQIADCRLSWKDIREIYRFGIPTDMIASSYLTIISVLVFIICISTGYVLPLSILFVVDIILSFMVSVICIADTALYKFWQFKIDKTVFAYLKSFHGAFASVSKLYIACALLSVIIMWFLFLSMLALSFVFTTIVSSVCILPTDGYIGWTFRICLIFLQLLLAGSLFFIIRGTKRRPQNTSIAYFSDNHYFNHSALNPLFSLLYSLSIKDDFAKQFVFFDEANRQKKFSNLFPLSGTPILDLLDNKRPNILLVVWEGLCSHFVGVLGGKANACPNIDRLSKEGVFFTNCHAGSFRTDRGLVCIISGYLGQPTTSVIKYSSKLPHLPALPRVLRDCEGYSTTVVHGGDLSIFHKSDYYIASGHSRLVSISDMPNSAPACSWGVHDHYMLDWLFYDIQEKNKREEKWFTTLQTLSSHEPWEVPYNGIENNAVNNSFAYVDDAFGRFIDRLKKTKAWDNLLVVVTGDHGVNLDVKLSDDVKNHLPLLFLGGAISQPKTVDILMNQTDIAATILGQMGIDHSNFVFSRDVLADTYTYPFAFYTYNNGFIFKDSRGSTNYDNVMQKSVSGEDMKREETGKVILQTLYQDLAKR